MRLYSCARTGARVSGIVARLISLQYIRDKHAETSGLWHGKYKAIIVIMRSGVDYAAFIFSASAPRACTHAAAPRFNEVLDDRSFPYSRHAYSIFHPPGWARFSLKRNSRRKGKYARLSTLQRGRHSSLIQSTISQRSRYDRITVERNKLIVRRVVERRWNFAKEWNARTRRIPTTCNVLAITINLTPRVHRTFLQWFLPPSVMWKHDFRFIVPNFNAT